MPFLHTLALSFTDTNLLIRSLVNVCHVCCCFKSSSESVLYCSVLLELNDICFKILDAPVLQDCWVSVAWPDQRKDGIRQTMSKSDKNRVCVASQDENEGWIKLEERGRGREMLDSCLEEGNGKNPFILIISILAWRLSSFQLSFYHSYKNIICLAS
jgi:hypothetical protein